jgi:iron complex outermembrane receptor protein
MSALACCQQLEAGIRCHQIPVLHHAIELLLTTLHVRRRTHPGADFPPHIRRPSGEDLFGMLISDYRTNSVLYREDLNLYAFATLLNLILLSSSGNPPPTAQLTEIHGIITDPSGAGIPNARITIETVAGKQVVTTTTDASGHYSIQVAGPVNAIYRERVLAAGFRTVVTDNVTLPDGVNRTSDFRLTVGDSAETVTVTADASIGNGGLATDAQAGSLGNLNLRDMPYAVSSYTAALMLDQQSQTVSEVLQNEVGIQDGNGRYSEDQYLTLRGFVLNPGQSLINGMPDLVDSRSPSLENIERVELFKGPTSFLNGASAYGAPGGTINMVTKRAGDAPLYRFDGGYSADNDWEGHLDVGRRFLPKDAFGVRVELGGRFGTPPVDNQEEHLGSANTGVDYRGDRFHVSVDLSDQMRSLLAYRDYIYLYPGVSVPTAPKMTSNLFDHSSSYTHHQVVTLAQGAYQLNSHAEIYGAYGHARELESYVGPGSTALTADATLPGSISVTDLPFTSSVHNNVGRLGTHLDFNTGPIHHAVTLAGDFLQVKAAYFYDPNDSGTDSFTTNLYSPVPLAPQDRRVAGLKGVPDTSLNRNSSVLLADVATALHGRLVVIGGLRGQWLDVQSLGSNSRGPNNTNVFSPCRSQCEYNKGVASPSIAALYHLPKGFSIYGNFMQDLQPGPTAPIGSVNVSQIFAPYVTHQQELGGKFEHGLFGATLALFQITEPDGVLNPVTLVYGVTGNQRNRGLEFSAFGNPVRSLRLISGISFLDARQLGTENPDTEGRRAQGIPGTQVNVGAEWMPSFVHSLALNARVTASNGQFADTANTQRIPAWARLDIGGHYTFETKLPTTLRVNLDNVTGNNYWESGLLGLAYTAPRTLRISGGIRF